MATGGKETTKKEILESISPEKIALMIDIINQHTEYKVVTTDEYNQLNQSVDFRTSTPAVRSKQHLANPQPHTTLAGLHPVVDNQTGINDQSYAKPRIPIFSGEEKSEVSFDVWKYEVKCIIREKNYTDTILVQSIRGSLKGKARSLLLSISDNATPTQIIDKLEGVYGNVFSSEALLQQFYSENQQPNQSVAEYGMKLESIIQLAVEKGQINAQAKNEMLRSKFWSGLRDPLLKNASRYKYDTIKDFDQLRKEIRSIELDLSNYSKSSTESKVIQQANVAQSDKLDELLKTLQSLNKRMESVEGELKKVKNDIKSNGQGYRGNYRGRGNFGRGRGGYQNKGQNNGQNQSQGQDNQKKGQTENLNE